MAAVLVQRRGRGKSIVVPVSREKHWPADRVARRAPASYQRPSEVLIRRCNRTGCGHWTPTRLALCVVCKQPALD